MCSLCQIYVCHAGQSLTGVLIALNIENGEICAWRVQLQNVKHVNFFALPDKILELVNVLVLLCVLFKQLAHFLPRSLLANDFPGYCPVLLVGLYHENSKLLRATLQALEDSANVFSNEKKTQIELRNNIYVGLGKGLLRFTFPWR